MEVLQITAGNKESYIVCVMSNGVTCGNIKKHSIQRDLEHLRYGKVFYSVKNEYKIKKLILKQHSKLLANELIKELKGYSYTDEERIEATNLLCDFVKKEYKEEK